MNRLLVKSLLNPKSDRNDHFRPPIWWKPHTGFSSWLPNQQCVGKANVKRLLWSDNNKVRFVKWFKEQTNLGHKKEKSWTLNWSKKMKFRQRNNGWDCEGSFSNGRRMVKLMWSQTVVWQTRQRCVQVCRRWRGWRKWAREGGRGEGGRGGMGGQGQPSPIPHHRLPTLLTKY